MLLIVSNKLIVIGLKIKRLQLGRISHDLSKLVHLGTFIVFIDLIISLTCIPSNFHCELVTLMMDPSLI